LPKAGKPPAYAYLYPDEDAKLLACKAVPLALRVLFGFLSREGSRTSEAAAMRFIDLDLERGTLTLDENKTDDPRRGRSTRASLPLSPPGSSPRRRRGRPGVRGRGRAPA
jgi:integrase